MSGRLILVRHGRTSANVGSWLADVHPLIRDMAAATQNMSKVRLLTRTSAPKQRLGQCAYKLGESQWAPLCLLWVADIPLSYSPQDGR